MQEQQVQEQPVQEQPVQEQPVQEQLVKEQPVEEQPIKEQRVKEQPVQEQTGRSKLGESWPPLTQAMTSKSLEKTRLSALSISKEQRFDPVIQEQQMTQEVTRVSLCICTYI